ncbi:MAG: T9SS type A sorting domain-containing protein [Ignavibacteriales bacterium]|nr:T9SS type A sorting domain-containing protein [Ignavibacteriales bacterium]
MTNNYTTFGKMRTIVPLIVLFFFTGTVFAQLPDLTISNVSVPVTASAGDIITVKWTTSNIGSGSTSGAFLFDGIYLSTDQNFDKSTDTYLSGYFHSLAIPAGSSEEDSTVVILPDSLNGNFYIFVNADDFLSVSESNETNNFAHSAIINISTNAPDLKVVSVTAPATGSSQQYIQVSYSVSNIGSKDITSQSWYDYIILSSDTVYDNGDDVFLGTVSMDTSLTIGDSYTRTSSVYLPTGLSGIYYVLVRTNAFDFLNELNVNNNLGRSTSISIDFKRPDLFVSQINRPDTVNAGDKLRFSYQITNIGDTSTNSQQWFDEIFISSDSIVGNDTLLTLYLRSTNLEQGQSFTISDSVAMPFGLLKGNYHVIIGCDMLNQINESNETNNIRISNPFLYGFNGPDLVVTHVQTPVSAFSGQQIQINWIVKNSGTLATNAPQWYDRVYLSPSPVFDPLSVTTLGFFDNMSYLGPGESYSNTQNVTLPNGINGSYYIFVHSDAFSQITEVDESNNFMKNDTAMQVNLSASPDLIVSAFSKPSTAFSGDTIDISYTVKNVGNGSTNTAQWYDVLYFTQDTVLDIRTVQWLGWYQHDGALAPESSYTRIDRVVLPNAISGKFYFYLGTDNFNNVYEFTAESNNMRRDSIDVVLTPPPDLVVTNVSGPLSGNSGKRILVSWSVQNQGSNPPFEPGWQDRLYISSLSTFNPESSYVLGTFTRYGILEPDSSYTRTDSVLIPDGLSGQYYIYTMTDWKNEVFENLFEKNNVTRSSATIQVALSPWPDLDIASMTNPSTVSAGQQVTINWNVTNSGIGAATSPLWKDKVYISSSATWDSASSTLLKDVPHTLPLLPSGSYSQTASVTLPVTISGTYYFYIITDAGNNVYEHTDEGNNIERSSAVSVQPYPPIDLRAGNVVIPSSGFSGIPVSVQFTVQNIGTGKTLATKWDDAVYLSVDTVLNVGVDSLLTVVHRMGALDVGESYTRDLSVRLPDGVSGNYYCLVRADTGNAVSDNNILNNIGYSTSMISVSLSPPPDLHVASVIAPSEGQSGQPITVRWTIQNSGSGQTLVSSWNDAIYLSSDIYLDPADTRLATKSHNEGLPASQSYSDSLEVVLPNYASGDLFLLIQTDSKNEVFEQSGEANNVLSRPITVNIAAPSDLIISNIIVPDSAIAGDDVTISWTIRNQGANPATGWIDDVVYLSSDQTWEVTDPVFGIYRRNINLAPGATMEASMKAKINRTFFSDSTGNLTAPMPGFSPGNYYAIVRTDIRNYIHENNENNNAGTSTGTTRIDVPTLQLDIPTITSFTQGEQKYFRVNVIAGQTLKVTLDGNAPGGSLEMYGRFGTVPTRSQFDVSYTTAFSPDQQITIPETNTGTYYILIFADRVEGDSIGATILAQALSFGISSLSPVRGGNSGDVTIMVEGARFVAGSTVKLIGSGGALPRLIKCTFIDASRIDATFDLTGNLPLGAYDVVVRRPDNSEATLAGGFTLEPGKNLTANLGFAPPSAIARGGSGFYSISVENTTNIDLPFMTVYIIIPSGQSYNVNSNNMQTLSQLLPDTLKSIIHLQNHFDEGAWRFVPLTARNVRVGQRLNIALQVNDVQGTEFPIQIAVDAIDRKGFVEGQLLYLELFRQALLMDTSGKFAPEFYNLAQTPQEFINTLMQVYVDLGILTPSDVSLVTSKQLQKIVEKVSRLPLSQKKLDAVFKPMITSCENELNWLELGGRLAIIAVGLITGALLAPVTLGVGAVLAVISGLGLGMNIGAIINDSPGLMSRIFCDDPRTPTPVIASKDPNDIMGPAGYGEKKWVALTQTMTYTVRFENDPKLATAPAQIVSVNMDVDSTLDVRSFRLGNFGFGSFTFNGAENRSHYSKRLDVLDSLSIYVDVSAGIDVDKNKAFWIFKSINPATGELPSNPLSGFLPVNDSLHRGEGFLTFSVKPKSTSHTGDIVNAKARIVFDVNDPIDTPPIYNTIDAGLPISSVRLLPPITKDTTSFLVRWAGADDSTGSGLKNYSIFVSKNDSPFVPWLSNVTDTIATFTGESGNKYGFFSLSSDNAGNIEIVKNSADALTLITGIDDLLQTIPTVFKLHQNYPNPFNPNTVIRYELPKTSHVTLTIFNVLGQKVATIVDEVQAMGYKTVEFRVSNLSSGVYFYRIEAVSIADPGKMFAQVKKMVVMK